MVNCRFVLKGIACISLLASVSAHAALLGPSYPAPGGNSFSGGTYSGFNTSAFSALYWGSSTAAGPSAGFNGSPNPLTFSSASGQVETFTGTSLWLDHNNGTFVTVPIELLVTLTGFGAQPRINLAREK